MEYPFKDLLPLDEVLEREGYYKDWTHLDPKVFYSLTQISNFIKTKGFGVDVRLLIAQLAEHFGLKTTQVVDLANILQQKFTNLEGVTQSFTNNINSLVAQMEADKDAVIANATVDSEVILARGGKSTLGARLDDTTTQLAQAVDLINYVEIKVDHPPVPMIAPKGDGVTDDRNAIQSILDVSGNKTVVFGNKTYLINPTQGLVPNSNTKIILQPGTTLKAKDSSLGNYYVIQLHEVENVHIIGNGGLIQGDRETHLGTTGEWGMGISMRNSKNIDISNLFIKDCWGDGIYVGDVSSDRSLTNENIKLSDIKIDNCRRLGLSLITVNNFRGKNIEITNTIGTNPQSGIDIEPNSPLSPLKDVVFENVVTRGNADVGVAIQNLQKGIIENVTFKDCHFYDGVLVDGGQDGWMSGLRFDNVLVEDLTGKIYAMNFKRNILDFNLNNVTVVGSQRAFSYSMNTGNLSPILFSFNNVMCKNQTVDGLVITDSVNYPIKQVFMNNCFIFNTPNHTTVASNPFGVQTVANLVMNGCNTGGNVIMNGWRLDAPVNIFRNDINKVFSSQSFEVKDIGKGFIAKSPDGSRWRLTPDNGGQSVWVKT